jgi:hypothetical protein
MRKKETSTCPLHEPQEALQTMIYPPKKDWGNVVLVLPAWFVMSFVFLVLGLNQPGARTLAFSGVIMFVVGLLIQWVFETTSYEITLTELIVRSGPLRWRIPLRSIYRVVDKKGLTPDRAWNPILSLDRLIIMYRRRTGRKAFFGIAISPKDKQGFLRELAERLDAHDPLTQVSPASAANRLC